jgi:hypothetical protein
MKPWSDVSIPAGWGCISQAHTRAFSVAASFPDGQLQAIHQAVRDIGMALCASHGCIATDLPEAQVTDTSWRIDHNHEMEQLAVLEAALGRLSSDTGP